MHIRFTKPAIWAGEKLGLLFVLSLAAVIAGTGLVALYEGSTRFMLPFTVDDSAAHVREVVAALRQAPSMDALGDVSAELVLMAQVTSIERFAESKLPEQGIYYASMAETNQILMVSHILLGVFCLLVGGFQFWPAFRKRFMRVHRIFGALYVITAPVSVLLALIYLIYTPPHYIYAHLVAWIALWIFGPLAILSIVMAVRAIMARRIHEHQAWMALSFGCLIVAPMLRLNWLLLALLFPEIDQETLNQVTMAIMVPELMLISYGLILANRQHRRALLRRKVSAVAVLCRRWFLSAAPLWFGLALLVIAINAAGWMFANGTLSLAPAGLIPGDLTSAEKAVFLNHPWLGTLLTVCSAAALLVGLAMFRRLLSAQAGKLSHSMVITFMTTSLLLAVLFVYTGSEMGLVTGLQRFSGGTIYVLAGILLGLLALFFLSAQLAGHAGLMKESLVFVLATLPFNALLLVFLWVAHGMALPAGYLSAGQGYLLPVGASMALFFMAMFYVVYGQATREHG